MPKNLGSLEKRMCAVLKTINKTGRFPVPDDGSEDEYAVIRCFEQGCIRGMDIRQSFGHFVFFQTEPAVRVTPDGFSFLRERSAPYRAKLALGCLMKGIVGFFLGSLCAIAVYAIALALTFR